VGLPEKKPNMPIQPMRPRCQSLALLDPAKAVANEVRVVRRCKILWWQSFALVIAVEWNVLIGTI